MRQQDSVYLVFSAPLHVRRKFHSVGEVHSHGQGVEYIRNHAMPGLWLVVIHLKELSKRQHDGPEGLASQVTPPRPDVLAGQAELSQPAIPKLSTPTLSSVK